jgi:hypothetical protein
VRRRWHEENDSDRNFCSTQPLWLLTSSHALATLIDHGEDTIAKEIRALAASVDNLTRQIDSEENFVPKNLDL